MSSEKSVVVVDDDENTRIMVTNIVKGFGHNVTSFASAEDALEGMPGKHFDLGIFDVMMPGKSGYELMTEVKETTEFSNLPVIMLTAKNDPSEILEGYAYGADYYITKPFDSRQLQYGIDIVLGASEKQSAPEEETE